MNTDTDIIIIDSVAAYSIESGDQIRVDGDDIEVTSVEETDDVDEILVYGYSHESGDRVEYSLYAFDLFDVWTV